jgi:4,5-dihydroxyphthalate decarboxylase
VHDGGVPLDAVEWHQAGVNDAGRAEKVDVRVPAGVKLVRHADRSLNDLLIAGDIDAAFSARPPHGVASGEIVRLFEDPQAAETDWYRRTGVFPIMHVVCMRRDVFDAHPWTAMNLMKAFDEAKRRAIARAVDITAAHHPVPWAVEHARRMQALFGDDLWPYGIEANRPTLEAFTRWAFEQGVAHRAITPDELFPAQLRSKVKV